MERTYLWQNWTTTGFKHLMRVISCSEYEIHWNKKSCKKILWMLMSFRPIMLVQLPLPRFSLVGLVQYLLVVQCLNQQAQGWQVPRKMVATFHTFCIIFLSVMYTLDDLNDNISINLRINIDVSFLTISFKFCHEFSFTYPSTKHDDILMVIVSLCYIFIWQKQKEFNGNKFNNVFNVAVIFH